MGIHYLARASLRRALMTYRASLIDLSLQLQGLATEIRARATASMLWAAAALPALLAVLVFASSSPWMDPRLAFFLEMSGITMSTALALTAIRRGGQSLAQLTEERMALENTGVEPRAWAGIGLGLFVLVALLGCVLA